MLTHHLPPQPTPFVNRVNELAVIGRLLADPACRLLTLLGPGGIGKTRLALQTASERAEDFAHGVYFVPLSAVSSVDLVVPAIADALQFPLQGQESPADQLLRFLSSQRLLLVLDTFEHLLDATALLTDILHAAPQVKLIVTSRERLRLQEEWVLNVAGLEISDLDDSNPEASPAIQLFLQRARQADVQFRLGAADKPFVARICRLVGGMPLGIELASSWAGVLPCREIADQLEHSLEILTTNLRNVPERHRSMRAAFDHSWKLLSEEEQQVFRRLSVFHGGFTREAAEQVAGARLPVLAALVDKSLIQLDAAGRYDLHDLMRQYAEEKLREIPEERERILDQHCQYYTQLVARLDYDFRMGGDERALFGLDAEIKNVEAAWQTGLDRGKPGVIVKTGGVMVYYFHVRGLYQYTLKLFSGFIQCLHELQPGRDRDLAEVRLLLGQGWYYHCLHIHDRARAVLEECRRLLYKHDQIQTYEGGLCYVFLGDVAGARGEHAEARQFHQMALDIFSRIDEPFGLAVSFLHNGLRAHHLGQFQEAKQLIQGALDTSRDFDAPFGMSFTLPFLGMTCIELGDYTEARQHFLKGLAMYRFAPSAGAFLLITIGTAALLAAQGRGKQAAELVGMVLQHPNNTIFELQVRVPPLRSQLESQLSSEILAAALERGRQITLAHQHSPLGLPPTWRIAWRPYCPLPLNPRTSPAAPSAPANWKCCASWPTACPTPKSRTNWW